MDLTIKSLASKQVSSNDEQYVLHYFDLKSRAEPIRYLFAYKSIPYVDRRFSFEDWPQIKPSMPNNQVPVLQITRDSQINGRRTTEYLTQISAILYYLAEKHQRDDESRQDAWTTAKLFEIAGACADGYLKLRPFIFPADEQTKQKLAKELLGSVLPDAFARLENLSQLSEDHKFVLGSDTPNWADFVLACHTELHLDTIYSSDESYARSDLGVPPKLIRHMQNVQQLPSIAAWIAKRPKTIR